MRVNLTVRSFIRQGFKTPASQLKSSKEDSMTLGKFSSLVHFSGLVLLARGFEPLAEMAEIQYAATVLVLRQVEIEELFLPSPTVGRGGGGEGYPSLLAWQTTSSKLTPMNALRPYCIQPRTATISD
jgi:hypothetical protein